MGKNPIRQCPKCYSKVYMSEECIEKEYLKGYTFSTWRVRCMDCDHRYTMTFHREIKNKQLYDQSFREEE